MAEETKVVAVQGLTLRDWFAGQALPACVTKLGVSLIDPKSVQDVAKLAYTLADAMRLARDAQPDSKELQEYQLKAAEALTRVNW